MQSWCWNRPYFNKKYNLILKTEHFEFILSMCRSFTKCCKFHYRYTLLYLAKSIFKWFLFRGRKLSVPSQEGEKFAQEHGQNYLLKVAGCQLYLFEQCALIRYGVKSFECFIFMFL